ncbi:1e5b89b2-c560-44a7-86f9-02cf282cf716 [Thermothielavioides terrestris]|uniref:1e5b89b2-c560-44a7-86f9-02cf282cf716 n=1 Tax=Thermothielavioides terrestris TaxID=2587410 RepID=A0A3S4D3V6_9PEZI|nr:1e5b89b2-c560-44a7-86f9-02cf282cf716 [Thermothielavioides terrestris]
MRINISLAILVLLNGVAAFWRMECRGRLGVARLDPLISPGTVSQHAHAIHGSSGFSNDATHADLVNGECTSCIVTQDKSAYWAPNLYFKHANGTYEDVEQVGGMLAYYFLNPDAKNPNGKIQAFPNDFRMIAGDSTRRNYSLGDPQKPDPEKSRWAQLGQTTQYDLAQRALGFNCLDYSKAPEGSLQRHYLPNKTYLDANCPDGVRFELSFPSCWNGKDITSPDFKSHVAYPDLVLNGNCPDGFNVKLPGLFYETIWATNAFKGVDGEFVISNGDVEGYGYHGDFMSGWDANFLQEAVDQCTNLSGRVQDCPIFTLQTEDQQRQCKLTVPSALANEKVTGMIGNSLPGGVAIQLGPGPAIGNNPQTESASIPVPTVGYTPEQHSSLTPSPTPTPSDPPVPAGYQLVRTDYVTNGNVVSKIVVIETVEYVMVATETVTVTATGGAEKSRRQLLHLHQHRHGSH